MIMKTQDEFRSMLDSIGISNREIPKDKLKNGEWGFAIEKLFGTSINIAIVKNSTSETITLAVTAKVNEDVRQKIAEKKGNNDFYNELETLANSGEKISVAITPSILNAQKLTIYRTLVGSISDQELWDSLDGIRKTVALLFGLLRKYSGSQPTTTDQPSTHGVA